MQAEKRSGPSLLLPETGRLSLCDVLDRILNTGAAVNGAVTVSVADVDLLFLGLNLVLTSVETACGGDQETSPSHGTGSRETGSQP